MSTNRRPSRIQRGYSNRASWVTKILRFLLAILLGFGGLGSALQNSAAAAATTNTDNIALTLKSMSPGTLTNNDDLKVTVSVRNTGSSKLTGAKATLELGTRALDSLTAQQRWQTSTTDISAAKTADANLPDLASGASTDVTLTLPASSINIAFSMTTLPVQVSVTGDANDASASASLHTVTPWTNPGQSFTKMTTQVVVPVTLPADPQLFSTTGATRFKAWQKAIGPGSAIDKLLSANPSAPVTWLIDPTVLDPPTSQDSSLPSTRTLASDNQDNPASGASPSPSSGQSSSAPSTSSTSTSNDPPAGASGGASAGASGSSTNNSAQPTTVDQLAKRLRDKLHQRPTSQQIWFTPYGDPDLSALTSDHRPKKGDALLRRMLARQLPASLQQLSNTVVAAPVSPLNRAATDRLSNAWQAARGTKPTVITTNATLTGSATASVSSSARRSSSGLLMYGADAALSETLANPDMSDADAAAAARARSLAIYQQQPSASRSVLAMGPRSTMSATRLTNVLESLKSLDWVQTASIQLSGATAKAAMSQLQTIAPSDEGVWPEPGRAEISSNQIARMDITLNDLGRYAGIVQDGSDIVPAWGRSIDQPASTRWRGHATDVQNLVESGHSAVAAIPGRVTVLPSGTINFFTDSGPITVTVRNDLARNLDTATLHLTPRSYAIRFTSKPQPMTIDAGSRAGVRVQTAAQAAGSVDIYAELIAHNGVVLGGGQGNPTKFTINARPTGTWIYWVLGIVALLIFSYGLARNRKKGTRRRDELARDIQL